MKVNITDDSVEIKAEKQRKEAEYKDGVLKITLPKLNDKNSNGRQL